MGIGAAKVAHGSSAVPSTLDAILCWHDALQEKYGQLYGGDCYVMLYTYLVNEREMYIIYFWQVRERKVLGVGL